MRKNKKTNKCLIDDESNKTDKTDNQDLIEINTIIDDLQISNTEKNDIPKNKCLLNIL